MKTKNEFFRLDIHQRIQHVLLIVSVTLLILTGIGLRFSDSFFGHVLVFLEGGFRTRGIIHRFSAVLLLVTIIYHFVYILFSKRGHSEFMEILLSWSDFKDYFNAIFYDLGFRKERPKLGWYSYREKFQYWAFAIFFFLMGFSGTILWFHRVFFSILPKWVFDIAIEVHGWTGTLVLIFLVFWHLYIVHFAPGKFPMSKSWLTGKISLKELKEDHGKVFEKLVSKGN